MAKKVIKYVGQAAYAAHVGKLKEYMNNALSGDLTQLLTNSKTPIGAINEIVAKLEELGITFGGSSSGGDTGGGTTDPTPSKKTYTIEYVISDGVSISSGAPTVVNEGDPLNILISFDKTRYDTLTIILERDDEVMFMSNFKDNEPVTLSEVTGNMKITAAASKQESSEPTITKLAVWDENFNNFDTTKITNTVNSWYTFSIDGGALKIQMEEPASDNTIGWFFIPFEEDKHLDLSTGANLSMFMKADGNPQVALRFVDSSNAKSSWIDVGAAGIQTSGNNSLTTTGTTITNANISSYLTGLDSSEIIGVEVNMIAWSYTIAPTFKERSKTLWIDNLIVENPNGVSDSGSGNTGGGSSSEVTKFMTTWVEDFSDGIDNVSQSSRNWYELDESSGRLSMILREPDTTEAFETVIINIPSRLDLSDGAYLSIDITSQSTGTVVNATSWNTYSCVAIKLKDADGNYSNWIEIGADGLGDAKNGIGGTTDTTVSLNKENISSYLGDIDRSNIVAMEITTVNWPSVTPSFKARDKGVYIDNIRLSRNTTETAEEGAASSGGGNSSTTKEYRRIASTYSFSTTDWNDAADIYKGVKSGDRLMIIVRHSERDSATGKNAGLNANGLSLLQQTAAPKLVGAPFANSSTDAYYSTNVKRTVETAYFIGNARGASGCTSSTLLGDNWESITAVNHSGDTESSIASVRVTPGPHTHFNDHFTGGTDWVAARDYYKNNKATCTQKCEDAINWLAKDSEGHSFTFVGSHDLCMVPFVTWATDNGNFFSTWNNDYDSNPSGWIMYMAGVAVIVHSDGSWEVYPVKCLDAGKFS